MDWWACVWVLVSLCLGLCWVRCCLFPSTFQTNKTRTFKLWREKLSSKNRVVFFHDYICFVRIDDALKLEHRTFELCKEKASSKNRVGFITIASVSSGQTELLDMSIAHSNSTKKKRLPKIALNTPQLHGFVDRSHCRCVRCFRCSCFQDIVHVGL